MKIYTAFMGILMICLMVGAASAAATTSSTVRNKFCKCIDNNADS